MLTTPTYPRSSFLHTGDHLYTSERQAMVAKEWVVVNETLSIHTPEAPHFIDLTDTVQEVLKREHLIFGSVLVFSKHTTCAIVLNEHEPLLLEDMSELLNRLVPHTMIANYRHDDMDIRTVNLVENEPLNGHAHCQHFFLGASVQIPINAGALDLGRWQRLFMIELDGPRPRQVVIQISGIRG